jgi:hypothetical protein
MMDKTSSTSMKHCLLFVIAWVLVWPSARAEDVEIPQCHVGGASALAECLEAKQKSEDGRLNGIYTLVMKMLDAGEVDPTSFFFREKEIPGGCGTRLDQVSRRTM